MISLTREDISRACSSNKFAKLLAAKSPFVDETSLLKISREIWWNQVRIGRLILCLPQRTVCKNLATFVNTCWVQMSIFDWLEAFQGHPTIGDRNPGISKMSSREQATAAETATEQTSADLLQWNAKYKERFGHIFLICARGRTSDEILQELQTRYVHV